MNKSTKILTFLLALLLSARLNAFAETLTLKEALDIALKNNHHIKSATATLPVEEAKLIIAKYRPNPFFNTYNELVTGGSIAPGNIGITIETGLKRKWRINVAKEEIKKKELEIQKVIWEIHTKVHIAYADLSIKQKLVELAKNRRNFYNSLLEIAKKKFEAGDASKIELSRAKVRLASTENDLSEFTGIYNNSKVEFNHLLGQEPNLNLVLEEPKILKPKIKLHEHPKIKEVIGKALEKRLEVAILEKEYGITRAKLKKAKWGKIPNITIQGGAVTTNRVWGGNVGGMFDLPVFNWKQGEIKEAKAQLSYLKQEEERIKHDIKIEVANAFNMLEVREEQVDRFQKSLLSESEGILDMTRSGYENGKFTLNDVLDAEEENRKIKEKYLKSLFDFRFSLASLEYAVGSPLFGFGEEL